MLVIYSGFNVLINFTNELGSISDATGNRFDSCQEAVSFPACN